MLACPPGEQHDLGLIAFGLVLREGGWRIALLGSDTPIETIADAVAKLAPNAVVLAAVTREPFERVVGQIRALTAATTVLIGGEGASEKRSALAPGPSRPIRSVQVRVCPERDDHRRSHSPGHRCHRFHGAGTNPVAGAVVFAPSGSENLQASPAALLAVIVRALGVRARRQQVASISARALVVSSTPGGVFSQQTRVSLAKSTTTGKSSAPQCLGTKSATKSRSSAGTISTARTG